MMSNNIKSGIGYLIPASAVVGFFIAILLGANILSIIIAVFGILGWVVYMLVVESKPPPLLGNLIILFGVMISVGVFMTYGQKANMWGGMELQTDGLLIALAVLFFSVLTGILFRGQFSVSPDPQTLSSEEQDLVRRALNQPEGADPKVIVVKQAQEELEEAEEENPYAYNPYAYASDYYDDEDYEDEDEDDDEEDWNDEDEE